MSIPQVFEQSLFLLYKNNSSCLKQIISVFAFLLPRRFLGLRLFTKVSEDPQIAAFHDRPHLEWIAPPKDPDGDPDEGLGPFPCVEPEVPPHNEQYALNDFQVEKKSVLPANPSERKKNRLSSTTCGEE